MKRALLLVWITLLACLVNAQQKFIYEGKIEFERKINVHRQVYPSESDDWFKDMVSKSPAFHNTLFTLQFRDKKSMYKPAQELPRFEMFWLLGPAKENIVFNDLESNLRISQKMVFERRFVISDTAARFKWRITDEKRVIAGMECRKAVTIICDSVYVVAFYTDEIPVSAGPESFGGLPGMILGLAIPRLHTTWFATKVMLSPPSASDLQLSSRGQQTDPQKLMSTLNRSFSDWGKYRDKNIWWILL